MLYHAKAGRHAGCEPTDATCDAYSILIGVWWPPWYMRSWNVPAAPVALAGVPTSTAETDKAGAVGKKVRK